MPQNVESTPAEYDRIRARIAENVRAELARAKISHTALPDMLGLARQHAARRWSGDTPYYAHEIAFLAVVLEIPSGRLLECDHTTPDPAR